MTAPAGLLDRIGGALFQPPQDMEGLLGPEDIKRAQQMGLLQLGTGLLAQSGPSAVPVRLGQAIGSAIQGAQQGYQGGIDNMIQRRSQAAQYGQLKLKNEAAQRAQQGREAILKQYPQPNGNDPDALRRWIDTTLPLWLQVDPDVAKTLSEVRKSIEPKLPTVDSVPLGDRTQIIDHNTGRIIREEKNGQGPGTVRVATEMTPVQQERLWNTVVGQFNTQTKDYEHARNAWTQLEQVRERAKHGIIGKEDLMQMIDGLAQLNNPKLGVRASTVKVMMSKLGSWKDKLETWARQGTMGQLTPSLAISIINNAEGLSNEHARQYENLRKRAAARGEHIGLAPDYVDASLPNYYDGYQASSPSAPKPPLSTFNFGGGAQ